MTLPFAQTALRCIAFIGAYTAAAFSHAAAIDQVVDSDTAYLLFSVPNKIERFDLTTGTALEALTLEKEATAFAVEGDTVYVAFNRELRAIDMGTGDSTFVRNFTDSVIDIEIINNNLYVFTPTGYDGTITALSTADYSLIDETEPNYRGSYFDVTDSAIFFSREGTSPDDIHQIGINVDGTIGSISDSPYHGDYPSSSKVWVSPDYARVFDDSGTVYFTENLNYAGSLGGNFDSITFAKGNPVISRGQSLFLFTSYLLDAGQQSIAQESDFLAAYEDTVFSFDLTDSSFVVEQVDLSGFALPEPGTPIDGATTPYQADSVVFDSEGVIYALSINHLTLFRWSSTDSEYKTSLPLQGPPSAILYVEAHERIYVGYESGKITYFDTSSETPIETHFTTLASAVRSMTDVGKFLLVSSTRSSAYTFDKDGTLASTNEYLNSSLGFVWSSSTDLIYTNGNYLEGHSVNPETGDLGDYSSTVLRNFDLRRNQVYLDQSGQILLTDSGELVSANSLDVLNSLSNDISAATWVGEQLVTLNSLSNQIQLWSQEYELITETSFAGLNIMYLSSLNSKLVVIGEMDGSVHYQLIGLQDDQDTDGVVDLSDNCPSAPNTDQADYDGDKQGDACDQDADNDGLTDEQEQSAGLNPLDESDAAGDVDNDGFSNLVEAFAGTDLSDPQSSPAQLESFSEDFNDGWPTGFYSLGLVGAVVPNGQDNTPGLYIPSGDGQPVTAFTALFTKGILAINAFSEAPWHDDQQLIVYVDGVEVVRRDVDNEQWRTFYLPLETGEHTISFAAEKDEFSSTAYGVTLDNLIFDQDRDGDNVPDGTDNCPHIANQWQWDDDQDGQGNDCDPLPSDPTPPSDTDEDGLFDYRDNCPELANPDQADIDNDGRGDACDPTDDRPIDSDNDGYEDLYDNCPNDTNPTQDDIDWDGIGDACDTLDNRPQDTDQDSHYDEYDNCPDIANAFQEDLDSDGVGNVCDNDMDGDGIDNTTEESYSFLDPSNPLDAWLDEDGDGASNSYEINAGHDPQVVDTYEVLDLSPYSIGPDGRYIFAQPTADGSAAISYWEMDQAYIAEFDTFLYLLEDFYFEVALTENGLEAVASGDNNLNYHHNDVLVPTEISEGGTVIIEDYHSGEEPFGNEPQLTTKYIQLVSKDNFVLDGESYPSITLESWEIGTPNVRTREVYAKGLGLVAFNNSHLVRFDPLTPDLNDDEVVPGSSSTQASTSVSSSSASNVQAGDSGSSSENIVVLPAEESIDASSSSAASSMQDDQSQESSSSTVSSSSESISSSSAAQGVAESANTSSSMTSEPATKKSSGGSLNLLFITLLGGLLLLRRKRA